MNIKGLDDFKLVMAAIAQVQQFTVTAEVKYRAMQGIFSMLRQHNIDVTIRVLWYFYYIPVRELFLSSDKKWVFKIDVSVCRSPL